MAHRVCAGVLTAVCACVLAGACEQQPGGSPAGTQPPATSQPPATKQPTQQPASRPGQPNQRDRIAEVVAKAIDKTHGGATLRTRSNLQCDVSLQAGGDSLQGKLTMQINGLGVRLDLADGSSMVFDGTTCWVAPSTSSIPAGAAVQRLLTWRSLIASPFMAGDSHVRTSFYRSAMVMGADVDGVNIEWRFGDHMPAQTLIGYSDSRKHEMSVIAGEALAGLLGLPTGDKAVHSVVFTDLKDFEGVSLPTTWWLYDWTESAGVRGDRLGTVTISNVRYPRVDEVVFTAPNGARRDRESPASP